MTGFEVGGRVSIDQSAFSHSPLSRSPHRLTGKVVSICDDPEITGAPEEESELAVELDGLSHSMYGPAVLTCSSVEAVRILPAECAMCDAPIEAEEGNPWSEICERCFEQVVDEAVNGPDPLEVMERAAKREAESRGYLTGNINQTDEWFRGRT